MRASDIIFAIPAILLALSIVTALGPGILDSALAIGVGYIPIFVRVVRAPVLSLRNADFVRAGRVLGFSRTRVCSSATSCRASPARSRCRRASRLPGRSSPRRASASSGSARRRPTASLGQMVSDSSSLAGFAWWTLAGPSIAIVLAVIGFNFLGDGLRDAADPRTQEQRDDARDRNDLGHLLRRGRGGRRRARARRRRRSWPTCARTSRSPTLTSCATRSRRCCRRPRRRSRRSAALDTLIGQRFAEVAAELAERGVRRAAPTLVCSHGQTVFHWVEGATRARHAAARPARVHRRANRRDGRQRPAHARHRRRRPRRAARQPARRAAARRRAPTASAARSTWAGSRT